VSATNLREGEREETMM